MSLLLYWNAYCQSVAQPASSKQGSQAWSIKQGQCCPSSHWWLSDNNLKFKVSRRGVTPTDPPSCSAWSSRARNRNDINHSFVKMRWCVFGSLEISTARCMEPSHEYMIAPMCLNRFGELSSPECICFDQCGSEWSVILPTALTSIETSRG